MSTATEWAIVTQLGHMMHKLLHLHLQRACDTRIRARLNDTVRRGSKFPLSVPFWSAIPRSTAGFIVVVAAGLQKKWTTGVSHIVFVGHCSIDRDQNIGQFNASGVSLVE